MWWGSVPLSLLVWYVEARGAPLSHLGVTGHSAGRDRSHWVQVSLYWVAGREAHSFTPPAGVGSICGQVDPPETQLWRGWDSHCSQIGLPAGTRLLSEAGAVHRGSIGLPFPSPLARENGLF